MIAFDPNSLCVQAEPHYYDFLFGKGDEPSPEHIVRHIEECQSCQEQLNQLKAALSQADSVDTERKQANSTIAAMLRLHFAYVGKPVTCQIVKPFLPTLLYPVLQINVPTPITTHLDNCRQCSKDLGEIRSLNLERKQLCWLSELFADGSSQISAECSEMAAIAKSVAAMDFRGITPEALKHLCKCPVCRGLLYEERQKMCDSLSEYGESAGFPCDSVSTIFDYVVPYGLDPANDPYAKFRKSFTTHAATCPICLAKMQELHNTVYGIAERANSEVVTTYHIDESAKAQAAGESDDLYAGFPIRVEIVDSRGQAKPQQSASTASFAAALKQKVSAINVKPLAKIAAVAAVILIAAALLLNTPTAKALTIAEIYGALQNVSNVYIARFVRGQTEPIQEQWVSRRLKVQLIKTKEELVLWDVPNRIMKIKQLESGAIEIRPLPPEMVSDAEKKMAGSLGLIPFTELSPLLKGSKWSPASDDRLPTLAKDIEAYDLTYADEISGGPTIFNQWRFFVSRETKLPQRVEFYRKSAPETEYDLKYWRAVEYLSDSEIQKVIEEASLPSE